MAAALESLNQLIKSQGRAFARRMWLIFPSDSALFKFFNGPYFGRTDRTLWERLDDGEEPKLRGFVWDATCDMPMLRDRDNLPEHLWWQEDELGPNSVNLVGTCSNQQTAAQRQIDHVHSAVTGEESTFHGGAADDDPIGDSNIGPTWITPDGATNTPGLAFDPPSDRIEEVETPEVEEVEELEDSDGIDLAGNPATDPEDESQLA